ncbi:MAG TPA: hypothetical protein VEQ58_21795, partial [Polyangiaceae bacterium]|nr:hypothetical protein [Polyangiaceae bacterium]
LLVGVWARSRIKPGKPPSPTSQRAKDEDADVERLDHLVFMNWTSRDDSRGCDWTVIGRTQLYYARADWTAGLRCDPTRPERICLTTLGFWRVRGSAAGVDGRPLAPTPSELFEAVDAMVKTIRERGLTPTLVLTEPPESCEFWRQWLGSEGPRLGAYQLETMTDFDWELVEIVPLLERSLFGHELAASLAARLRRDGSGIAYGHKYYCGHGLRFADGRYRLEIIEDGLESTELMSWADEQQFIDAVASWSDYTCSGADPNAPLFKADSAFELANQRISRDRIEEFLAIPPS